MTETTTPAPSVLDKLDPFQRAVAQQMVEVAQEYNSNAAVLAAAQGDVQGLLETLRTESQNAEVQAINAKIAELDDYRFQLDEKRDALLKPEVEARKAEALKGSEGLDEKNKELAKKFNAARNYVKQLVSDEVAAEILKFVPALKSGAKGTGGTGQTGVRRIRHRNWTVPVGDGTKTLDSASMAAKAIGVETEDLQNAFFTAAGSDDSDKWNDTVEFTVTKGDKSFNVVSTKNVPDPAPAPANTTAASEGDSGTESASATDAPTEDF